MQQAHCPVPVQARHTPERPSSSQNTSLPLSSATCTALERTLGMAGEPSAQQTMSFFCVVETKKCVDTKAPRGMQPRV